MLRGSSFDAFLTPGVQTYGVAEEWYHSEAYPDWWGNTVMLEAFIDSPMQHRDLTVFPVLSPHGPVLPYLLSTDIQDSGALTVREKGDEVIPMLLARNNSLHPILILAGEPLPGGDPGRLVERSVLLGGKSVTQIPASGRESGGWANPEQEAEITDWLQHFPLIERQVGLLAFFGDRLLGLEALGAANLYGPLHRRLLIRFIKETFNQPSPSIQDLSGLEEEARKVVDALGDADRVATKRVGAGDYWSLSGPIFGGDLIYQGHLVHLSVHPAPVGMAERRQSEGAGQCY